MLQFLLTALQFDIIWTAPKAALDVLGALQADIIWTRPGR